MLSRDVQGHVVTNAHVIASAADVSVTLSDGLVVKAQVSYDALYWRDKSATVRVSKSVGSLVNLMYGI